MLFLSKQPLALLLLHFLGNAVHPTTASFLDFFNPACISCRTFGTLLHYNDTTTKKCVETCVLLGRLYQSPTLKCGKCPPTPPPPPPPPPPDTSYNIALDVSGMATNYRPPFQGAKAKWETVITGDLPSFNVTSAALAATTCKMLQVGQIIDDLFICGVVKTIDGPGKFLAFAGPDFNRNVSGRLFPAIGHMEFDVDDIDGILTNGRLDRVILHEMGHVLGIGTLWTTTNLAAPAPPCSYPYGALASREYRTLSGCQTAVPLENTGQPGTYCGHWDERCMQSELMTGIDTGANELSRVTVAGLDDLGYRVDYNKAEPFTNLNAECKCTAAGSISTGDNTAPADNNNVNDVETVVPLSEEGRKAVIEAGKKYLAAAAARVEAEAGVGGDAMVAAAQVVSVLYEENGRVYSFVVRNDD